MQHTHNNRHNRQHGFTLVELLIVAPLVILVIAGLIAAMTILTSDALKSRRNVDMAYTAQSALDRIEQDVRTSTAFLASSGSLPSPQGPNAGFNGDGTFVLPAGNLMLVQPTTTQNPLETSRSLVYIANTPFPCGTDEAKNSLLNATIVYYPNHETPPK